MNATALHARDGENRHWVRLNKLRVLVVEQHGEWFAQGVDIDYAASGRSLEEVKQHFEEGLAATVNLHLQRFATIERLLNSPLGQLGPHKHPITPTTSIFRLCTI